MNVDNILMVADAIEQHSIPDLGFNMMNWVDTNHADKSGHNCGTTACIAGWAYVVATGRRDYENIEGVPSQARSFLGLDYYESSILFEPPYEEETDEWDKITPAQAVRTLRHLAATGLVDWELSEPAAA